MESKDVDEKVEWEAKRVAAAFGRKDKKGIEVRQDRFVDIGMDVPSVRVVFRYRNKGMKTVDAHLLASGRWIISLECGFSGEGEHFRYVRSDGPHVEGTMLAPEMLAALYKLGLDTQPLQRVFNLTLSAHEKLEPRLSLSREFWPKTWLEEEEKS